FRLFRDGGGRKESGAVRNAARPLFVAKQAGNARTDERAKDVVMVETPAGRERQPQRDVHIVLHEDACRRVRIGKLWCINRLKPIALDGGAGHDGVVRDGTSDRELAESSVVIVSFGHLAELMPLMLC